MPTANSRWARGPLLAEAALAEPLEARRRASHRLDAAERHDRRGGNPTITALTSPLSCPDSRRSSRNRLQDAREALPDLSEKGL